MPTCRIHSPWCSSLFISSAIQHHVFLTETLLHKNTLDSCKPRWIYNSKGKQNSPSTQQEKGVWPVLVNNSWYNPGHFTVGELLLLECIRNKNLLKAFWSTSCNNHNNNHSIITTIKSTSVAVSKDFNQVHLISVWIYQHSVRFWNAECEDTRYVV